MLYDIDDALDLYGPAIEAIRRRGRPAHFLGVPLTLRAETVVAGVLVWRSEHVTWWPQGRVSARETRSDSFADAIIATLKANRRSQRLSR